MIGEDDDPNRTVIRPRPGGRRASSAAASMPGGDAGAALERFSAENELVAAAGPLLMLAAMIRGTATQPDVEGLRRRAAGELKAFEERATRLDIPRQTIRQARFALAATIDDIAQNTPWGGNDVWARRSLVTLFDRESIGGERFYELLDTVHREPGTNIGLLELMYLCLAFGFEGRLRIERRGQDELVRVRNGLHATIRNQRGEVERDLSPAWRGMEVPHRALKRRFPVWVVWATTAAAMALIWLGLSYLLNVESDAALVAMAAVPGFEAEDGRVPIAVETPEPEPGTAPPPPPPAERIRAFLKPEIDARLVEVLEVGQSVMIRILETDMFGSGSDVMSDKARAIVARIAEALKTEPGPVKVVGHSDNVPIRSARFPSNWALSEARAQSAAGLIRQLLNAPARVEVEGRGSAEPIADNATREGRALNRRIEVTLRPVTPPDELIATQEAQ